MHGVSVVIVDLKRSTLSEHDGTYEFSDVPPGTYHVLAHRDHLFTEIEKTVTVGAGKKASVDFLLTLAREEHEISVTASGEHETTFESFQDVEAFDSSELAETPAASLGEVLDHLVGTGIAKRSSRSRQFSSHHPWFRWRPSADHGRRHSHGHTLGAVRASR